jgi:carbamoyl-phosphate synthase large subunit
LAEDIPVDFFKELKQMGYSDAQIAWLLRINEHEVTRARYKHGIRRTYKMVDTCAAEFEAQTPYFYSTFDRENESIPSSKKKIVGAGFWP